MILPPPAPRNRGRGKRRASPPPAEPSPFGNPLPGTPLHLGTPKGGGLSCAKCCQRSRGEGAARGRPSPRPSGHGACKPLPLLRSRLPPRGAPRIERQKQRSKDSGSALHAFTSLRRQARFIARSRAVHGGAHVARPRTRPPPARERAPAHAKRSGALSRAPIRPNRAPRLLKKRTVKKKKGRGRRDDDDMAIRTMYAPPGPLRSPPQCAKSPSALGASPAAGRRRKRAVRADLVLALRFALLCSGVCPRSMRGLSGFARAGQAAAPCVGSLRGLPALRGRRSLIFILTA